MNWQDLTAEFRLIGPEAYLYGESVLAMLHLAPTNPKMMFVATSVRVRKKLESGFVVLQNIPCSKVVCYEGIPSQPVADAIRSCFGTMMPGRLRQAIDEGVRKECLDASEARQLKKELNERNICAHQGRLWNRKINSPISYSFGNNADLADLYACLSVQSGVLHTTLFTVLSLCAWMLRSIRPQSRWTSRVKDLMADYPEVPLSAMGFPVDWQKFALWK